MADTGRADLSVHAESPARRGLWFAVLSTPLLLGLFLPGLGLLALLTVPLAHRLAPQIWPGAARGRWLVHSLSAVLAVWALPLLVLGVAAGLGWSSPDFLAGVAGLLIPLCAPDAVGLLVPAAAATTSYALVGWAAVTRRQSRLWPVAALLVPPVHALALWLVTVSGLGGEVVC